MAAPFLGAAAVALLAILAGCGAPPLAGDLPSASLLPSSGPPACIDLASWTFDLDDGLRTSLVDLGNDTLVVQETREGALVLIRLDGGGRATLRTELERPPVRPDLAWSDPPPNHLVAAWRMGDSLVVYWEPAPLQGPLDGANHVLAAYNPTTGAPRWQVRDAHAWVHFGEEGEVHMAAVHEPDDRVADAAGPESALRGGYALHELDASLGVGTQPPVAAGLVVPPQPLARTGGFELFGLRTEGAFTLHAIRLSDRVETWNRTLSPGAVPVGDAGHWLAVWDEGQVHVVDVASGAERWSVPAAGGADVHELGGLPTVAYADGRVEGRGLADGAPRWELQVGWVNGTGGPRPPRMVPAGEVTMAWSSAVAEDRYGRREGRVTAFGPDGTVHWRRDVGWWQPLWGPGLAMGFTVGYSHEEYVQAVEDGTSLEAPLEFLALTAAGEAARCATPPGDPWDEAFAHASQDGTRILVVAGGTLASLPMGGKAAAE